MNIPFNQIKAFCTVAKLGSFAQASQSLHLSQPALSISIKNLEQTLGGRLLVRTTRSVSLTPEGEAYYQVASRLLSDWEQSVQDVRNHFSLSRGKLVIAAMPTFAANKLPALLAKYHISHPDINVTMHDVIAETVVTMVRNEKCELGVTFDPGPSPDLLFTPLYNDRFIAIMPTNHELAKNSDVDWQTLLTYPHISLQRPAGTRAFIDKALAQHNLSINPIFECQQLVTIGKMVKNDLGISVVPSTSKLQMLEMGLVCKNVKQPAINHCVGLLTSKTKPLSVAAQEIYHLIETSFK